MERRYGWKPDSLDERDFKYTAPAYVDLNSLPKEVDLRPFCPPVYNQGTLGSCTANAICGLIEFDRKKQNLSDFVPSRLFVYYNERAMEGTVNEDAGAMIRDGIKSVASQGVCKETDWQYLIEKFATKPAPECYQNALKDRAVQYSRVNQSLSQMKACLAEGFPFVFGITIFESFESQPVAQTGKVPMPKPGEQTLGGHAVMVVGYDDTDQTFLVRNSWGPMWGIQGYFKLPYQYATDPNIAQDIWTIRFISQ